LAVNIKYYKHENPESKEIIKELYVRIEENGREVPGTRKYFKKKTIRRLLQRSITWKRTG